MCYPKPGPRCPSALKARKKVLVEKLNVAQEQGHDEQIEKVSAELRKLNNEFALTTDGLKILRQKAKDGEIDRGVYEAAKAERKRRIYLSKNGLSEIPKSHGTGHALESSMMYDGKVPGWFKKEKAGPFGAKPQILDVIDTSAGKMAVVWEEESTAENDFHVQTERGINLQCLTYRDIRTGEVHGYLKLQSVDSDSMARSFGNDEWSVMRFYSDRCGSTFMTRYENDGTDTDLSSLLHDPNTRLDTKKEIWVGAHRATQVSPPSSDKTYYNLTKDDAPSEEEMDRDLSRLQKEYMVQEWDNYQKNHSTPTIDYARLNDSLKGQGLGPAMYVYGARKLAEKGKVLRSSSIQSDDAMGLWGRMAKDKRLPISTRQHSWSHDDEPFDVMVLDFTEQSKK